MSKEEEVKTVFIHIFKAKNAPAGMRAGSIIFDSHTEADIKASLLSPSQKSNFVSVGKCRLRVKG